VKRVFRIAVVFVLIVMIGSLVYSASDKEGLVLYLSEWDTPVGVHEEGVENIGQSFTADEPFSVVGFPMPTFVTQGSGCTLSLFKFGTDDNPAGELIAERIVEDIVDNKWYVISMDEPLPAGRYYLEQSAPVGCIGWWSLKVALRAKFPGEHAYVNRQIDKSFDRCIGVGKNVKAFTDHLHPEVY
jgi:hypothetical protein